MKATTYISNTLNKANMKRFYNKYIICTTFLLTSFLGGIGVMGQTQIYKTNFQTTATPPPAGTATWTNSSAAFATTALTGWTNYNSTTYPSYSLTSGSTGSSLLTFSTPLTLTSNGSNCGTIVIEFGHGTAAKGFSLFINGSSVATYTATAAKTLYSDVAIYTIPTTTTSISTIQAKGASTSGLYLFTLQVNTYSGCITPTKAYNVTADATTICSGNTVTIGLDAAQNGVTYQLYKNGVAFGGNDSIHSTATTAISFPAVTPANGDVFTVYAKEAYGYCATQIDAGATATSKTITVNSALSAVALTPSGAQSITTGGTGSTLTAAETGGGTITARQWGYRTASGGAITDITGATGSTYTPTGADLGGTAGDKFVVCTSTPTCGSATVSNEVTVTLTANTAPTFVTGSPTLTVCENASASSVVSQLHVSDADGGQTLTWSQSVAPSHGTLSFSSATASSGSTDVTPGGTITYTPTASYNGADAFTVQVSDGTATATVVVNVTVKALPATPTGVSSNSPQCVGTGITFSSSASAPVNETWYWQTSTSGTNTTGYATPYTSATTAATYTYYLRSYNSTTGCWSAATSSVSGTVNAAPAISVQPNSPTATISGSATTMTITASNTTGYQWQYCATTGGTYTNVADGTPTGVTYSGATSATLSITAGATASAGSGYYKCVLTGTAPCANLTSNYGTLTISTSSSSGTIALLYTGTTPASGADKLYTGLVNAGYTVTTLLASNVVGDTAAIMANLMANYDAVVLHEAVSSTNATATRLGTYIGRIPILNMKVHMFGKTNWPTGSGNDGVATDVSVTKNTTYSSHSVFTGVTFSGNNATMSSNVIRWVSSVPAGYKVLALNHSNTAGTASILEKDISTTLGEKMVTIGMSAANEAFTANGLLVCSNALGYILKKSIFASVDATGNQGTISDLGESLVTKNGSKTYTFTPDPGYQVYDIVIDGVSTGLATSTYTFSNVTASHSIKVVFGLVCTNPSISGQPSPAGETICANANAADLSVTASGTTLTYQWYSNTTASNTGGTLISGATSATYDPSTATAGTKYYYVVIRSTGGCPVASDVTGAIVVNALPAISAQSTNAQNIILNGTASAMTVTASGTGISYQWYSSTDASNATSGDDVAVGTNSNSYTPATNVAGTLYYYCQVSGTCTPAVKSTISGAVLIYNAASAPTTQATNITFSPKLNTSMTITWTRGNGDSIAVFVKTGSGAITNPTNDVHYAANTTIGSGGQLGTSGYYCVYKGTGTSVALSGLTQSTLYTVQAFEYNSAGSGVSTAYYTATATGNPASATTLATPACITGLIQTAVESSTTSITLDGSGDILYPNKTGSSFDSPGRSDRNCGGATYVTPAITTFYIKLTSNNIQALTIYGASNSGSTDYALTSIKTSATINGTYTAATGYSATGQLSGYSDACTSINITNLDIEKNKYIELVIAGSCHISGICVTPKLEICPATTVATAGNIGATTFKAKWHPSDCSLSNTYTLEYSDDNFATILNTVTGITDTTYQISGLTESTTYKYRVYVVNTIGTSAVSDLGTATTIASANQRILTVSADPTNGGFVSVKGETVSTSTPIYCTDGEEVTLTATATSGNGFLRYMIGGSPSTLNIETVTMNSDLTVEAKFAPETVEIFNFDDSKGANYIGHATYNTSTLGYEMSSIGTYYIGTSGGTGTTNSHSCTYSGNSTSYTDDKSVSTTFYFKLNKTISSFIIGGYCSTSGRAISSIGTSSSLTGTFNSVSFSSSGSISSGSCYEVEITPANIIEAGTIMKVSFNGSSITANYIAFNCPPDAVPPTFTFDPANAATNVLLDKTCTITVNEALYMYNSGAGTYTAIDNTIPSTTLDDYVTLTKVSDGSSVAFTASASADGKTITINPDVDFAYATQYRLSISNVADQYQNLIPTAQYSDFTTRSVPNPIMSIKENATRADVADGGAMSMGTIFTGTYVEKTFKIYNSSALDALTLTLPITFSGANAGSYSITTAPSATVNPGDSTSFVVRFTPATAGTHVATLNIANNSTDKDPYNIDFTGGKVSFIIPYTYQSGCTSPIYTTAEVKQDYAALTDIPAEIKLGSGSAIDASHFYPTYSVFHVEGNCVPSGNSALRVGQGSNGLRIEVPATKGLGTVTVKWCSTSYRKIRITGNDGNTYEQSASFLPGGTCYTTKTVVNKNAAITIDIEFIGTDPDLLTTVYYLELTPFDAEVKSSAKDIVDFDFAGVAEESIRIYDDVIFVTVPTGANSGNLTTSVVKTSPYATVSPAQGASLSYSSASGVSYTVTAQNGTTKTYKVYVEETPTYNTSENYIDIANVPMNSTDQTIEILEISNSGCTVPTSGTGSEYTLYFLNAADKPAAYTIGGLNQVCIGSEVTYSITNAPASNNPAYTWVLTGEDIDLFTLVNATIASSWDRASTPAGIDSIIVAGSHETLTLKAPDVIPAGVVTLNINIKVQFDPGCAVVSGDAQLPINVTDDAPQVVTSLSANCIVDDKLTVKALGATGSATAYNWSFTPSNIQVISQTNNEIVLNLQGSTPDITATVTSQNGCGFETTPSPLTLTYANDETTWTGAIDSDWSKDGNWTNKVPKACTNVIIPDVSTSGVNYPTISAATACNYITFEPNAGVLGLENLSYAKAFIQAELQRQKWYTMTPPLKEMYSGDYYFNGAPATKMRLFDTYNPDSASTGYLYTNKWTKEFNSTSANLETSNAFAFYIENYSWNYPYGKTTSQTTNKVVTFPRMNTDNTLAELYIPYSNVNGKLLAHRATNVTKDDFWAYRLSAESEADTTIHSTFTTTLNSGLNLVGNPMMTHLSFARLYSHNNTTIENKVKFFNGTNYVSGTVIPTMETIWSTSDYSGDTIAPMQAFIVNKTGSGNLIFNISEAPTDFVTNKTTTLRSARTSDNILYVVSNNGLNKSTTSVALRPVGTNNFGKEDVFKMFADDGLVPEIYTSTDGVALDINLFNKLPYTTPLAIKTTTKGRVDLTFKGATTFEDVDVHLINSITGEKVNLKEQPKYIVEVSDSITNGTLFIEFRSASISTDINTSESTSGVQIFVKNNNTIQTISSPSNSIKEVLVLDETGRVIVQHKNLNSTKHEITMNNTSQVYIVKVITENEVKISKVLIK